MQRKKSKATFLNVPNAKVGIVVAKFNSDITSKLLASAQKTLALCGVKKGNIAVVEVAGAAELPHGLQRLALKKRFDCLVALGCIIKGETPHFDYVCKMAQEGVLRVSLDYVVPIGFGVVTVNNLKQANARIYVGGEAALAALGLTKI
ncbi:MAG TPA: 6,7-dimethyl-8-ribityllumazine synthase [Patescibacteria group bacterium]|nr:6,7-dimethyl-8-ribityllumazine synthase [Patescibacteria group bacterium]